MRNWLIYTGLALGVAGLMFDGLLTDSPLQPPLPSLSQAVDVRSAISDTADSSLVVVVAWELTLSQPAGAPDSVRVSVGLQQSGNTVVSMQPASRLADTAYLPAPAVGRTVRGLSCVSARHPGEILQETCTPWQYVPSTMLDDDA